MSEGCFQKKTKTFISKHFCNFLKKLAGTNLIFFDEPVVSNSPIIYRFLPSMIVAIMEEFCLLMQSLAKITLSQDFQDFHIAKPSNPVTKTTI